VNSGELTAIDVKSDSSAAKALSKLLVNHLMLLCLQDLTNHVAFEKNGNRYIPIFSEEVAKKLSRFRSKTRQKLFLEEIYEPFSMGGVSIDLPKNIEDGTPIPRDVQDRLHRSLKRMKPALEFDASFDNDPAKIGVTFQIHPMIVDVRKKKAYFDLSIGLQITPEKFDGENPQKYPWLNPGKWKPEDRNQFWDQIFKAMEFLWKGLARPKTEIKEAIVTLQATLRLPVNSANSITPTDLMKAFAEKLPEGGKIDQFQFKITDSAGSLPNSDPHAFPADVRIELKKSLKKVSESKTAFEKGNALEQLTKLLFETVPGFSVKERRVHSETEEIDIVVINRGDEHPWDKEQPIILIECKNWSSKCGKNEFVLFKEKIKNRKSRCSVGVLVSWNGFAGTVTKEMLRVSQESLMIIPVDGNQISDAVESGGFSAILCEGWERATMI
jgi:hypothetical protein